jgi:hypothetical protein
VRWHRKGFAAFWRWKSRPLGGRPQVDKEVHDLIRRMSFEKPLYIAQSFYRADRYQFTVRLKRYREEGQWRWDYQKSRK